MFENFRRERFISRTLRRLARQRVALVLPPNNVLVIELAIDSDDHDIQAALRTCLMRGWAEILEDAIPSGKFDPNDSFASGPPPFTRMGTIYRITDSGWSMIHRDRTWALAALIIAAGSFLVSIVAILR